MASCPTSLFRLNPEWKQHSVDVSDKDMPQIKTGFAWSVAGQGKPVVCYLDDISYE